MHIEIIGAESLGVRGLCCFVTTRDKRILIDPGIALGYMRHGLLPHPVQVAIDEKIQKKIIAAWSKATDIVLSHFHGDHIPLADANPYQLDIRRLVGLNTGVRIWTKDPLHFSQTEKKRAEAIADFLNVSLISAEFKEHGPMTFSGPIPHGDADDTKDTVLMTRIEEDEVFVHAPDIQLLNDDTISNIIFWRPDIVLAGGPPIYLSRLSKNQIERAWHNALRLCRAIDCVILDHHLMRSHDGLKWLKQLSIKTGKKVMCAADFMHKPRLLLEANREHLYEKIYVPDKWHEDYGNGKAFTDDYKNATLNYLTIS